MIALRRGAKRAHVVHTDSEEEDYTDRLDALIAHARTREQADGMLRILERVVATTDYAHQRGNALISTDVTIRLWRDGGDLIALSPEGHTIDSLTVRWQA